jgi:hypothetical protein
LTSIDNIDADLGDNIAFNIDGGLATVVRADGGDIYVAVYSLQGALLKRVAAKASATVDLNALSSGMYIIKANQKVIKLKK